MTKPSKFICPTCQGDLSFHENENYYACLNCNTEFPIVSDIPRFLTGDNYTDSFGFQWNIHRRTQLDSYTGLSISSDRVRAITGWSERTNLKKSTILEAGSGAGRFTEIILKTGATVVSFDFSSAVEANFLNNGRHKSLSLFQGDIFSLPLQKASFDYVMCLGVLQHTPNPKSALGELSKMVKPGGKIFIDVYSNNILHILHWKYLLRPFTKVLDQRLLYKFVCMVTPVFIPVSKLLKLFFGRFGARIVPIVEFSNLGLSADINREWAILDTFDMYSPKYDKPASKASVETWLLACGFTDISVKYGANGIVAVATKK